MKMSESEYDLIPSRTKAAIDAWVNTARPVGGFLRAVLSNDLAGAVSHADDENIVALPIIVRYLYNRCPAGCWGSEENFMSWPEQIHQLTSNKKR